MALQRIPRYPLSKAAIVAAFSLSMLTLAGCQKAGSDKPVAVPPAAPAEPAATVIPAPPPQPPATGMVKPVPVQIESPSLWSDWLIYDGWKIQQHFYSGQFRLVDGKQRLRARGSEPVCRQALTYLRWKENVRPRSRKLALLVHGLASAENIWGPMQRGLEADGYSVTSVTYPSTEQSLILHGNILERVLLNLDPRDYDSVTIIAHSLGGLVTRSALARPSFERLPVPVTGVVMLGTPNQGATLASMLRPLARAAVTASANDLLPERAKFIGTMPKSVRFGVIAGGRGNTLGFNPVLAGDDDGIVKVEETRTDNMDDFLVLPVMHMGMAQNPTVVQATRRFLRSGSFSLRPAR